MGRLNPVERGPVIGSLSNPNHRNVIGTHSGSYAVYRALAIASGKLQSNHRADLTNTSPPEQIGSHPSWHDPDKIVCLDPLGQLWERCLHLNFEQGYDIRRTIAITKANINMPELQDAVARGVLKADGNIVKKNGNLLVTKAAIDPVWYLPGVAKRLNVEESELRRVLFQQMGGMFPELVTRPDLHLFLPPIGGTTVYIIGNIADIFDLTKKLAVRVHDESNG
ncbi:hypothetical protein ACP6PL_30540 [Dapis sp. BLCC M126]|uniref:hypothetical protein n=1 Tax=Dapis sp. BLCC M126 TaxID=3400189 RepID=UPI003CECFF65